MLIWLSTALTWVLTAVAVVLGFAVVRLFLSLYSRRNADAHVRVWP